MSVPRSPAIARWLLRRVCASPYVETVEGDIEGLFSARLRAVGRWRAATRSLADVASVARAPYGRLRLPRRGGSKRPTPERSRNARRKQIGIQQRAGRRNP